MRVLDYSEENLKTLGHKSWTQKTPAGEVDGKHRAN